jgi:iron complex transport system substrate-binding protein
MHRSSIAISIALAALSAAACGQRDEVTGSPTVATPPAEQAESLGTKIPMRFARTFTVTEHTTYRVAEFRAYVVTWGGAAAGPALTRKVLLVPRGSAAPPLQGALTGATIVYTPLQRVAVNYGPLEAMLAALAVDERLVAVGGTKSYNDDIRERVARGTIRQIGYGWHMAPQLDAVVASKPDALLMSLGDLSHLTNVDRLTALGIPIVPIFLDNEPHYLGRAEYIRLVGMLLGKEKESDRFFDEVVARVEALRAAAAQQPRRKVAATWFSGGDRWMATVRNADARLLTDANADNLLSEADNDQLDSFAKLSTEDLLRRARDADCWIARDSHSQPFANVTVLRQFRAFRENCIFASDGMQKPSADAFDYYETALIRPDLLLADIVRMLHPPLRTEPFLYIRPDSKQPR